MFEFLFVNSINHKSSLHYLKFSPIVISFQVIILAVSLKDYSISQYRQLMGAPVRLWCWNFIAVSS